MKERLNLEEEEEKRPSHFLVRTGRAGGRRRRGRRVEEVGHDIRVFFKTIPVIRVFFCCCCHDRIWNGCYQFVNPNFCPNFAPPKRGIFFSF